MRTIRTKVYKFEELSEGAQQTAIDAKRLINVEFDWWVNTYEDAENIGLKLTGFDLERNKHATGKFINDAHYTSFEIVKNHGESCETYKIAKAFQEKWDEAVKLHSNGIETGKVAEGKEYYFDNYVGDFEDDFLKDILNAYANMLENECYYLQMDEVIKETLISNDYEFTKNGHIFNA